MHFVLLLLTITDAAISAAISRRTISRIVTLHVSRRQLHPGNSAPLKQTQKFFMQKKRKKKKEKNPEFYLEVESSLGVESNITDRSRKRISVIELQLAQ